MDPRPTDFNANRPRLYGIAYRLLGSRAEAEDILQDAWLRWHDAGVAALRTPQAWLVTVVTRLCIDRLRSAKAEREAYIGPWLLRYIDGRLDATLSCVTDGERIVALYMVRNPDKLKGIG